jgi:hypothetical protein
MPDLVESASGRSWPFRFRVRLQRVPDHIRDRLTAGRALGGLPGYQRRSRETRLQCLDEQRTNTATTRPPRPARLATRRRQGCGRSP